MGPGNRLGNEARDLNRQVPRQRQRNSAAQTQSELTTDRAPLPAIPTNCEFQHPLSRQGMPAFG